MSINQGKEVKEFHVVPEDAKLMSLRELLLTYRITAIREDVESQGALWDVWTLENGVEVWILDPRTVTVWPDTSLYS